MQKKLLTVGVVLSIILIFLNIYGLFQDIEPKKFEDGDLRFDNSYNISYQDAVLAIKKNSNESEVDYAIRLTEVISSRMSHIKWSKIEDPERYNQLIPIWENYILYFMGRLSITPEFKKYHFTNHLRSLKRGVGICGDAAMIMSTALENENIKNKIVSFPRHVVVALESVSNFVFDPDFGVTIPLSLNELIETPKLAEKYYLEKGFSQTDIKDLSVIYKEGFKKWDGTRHFVTKKYYFEILSYYFIWLIPLMLLLLCSTKLSKLRKNSR